jgi:sulfite dehydrogenase
MLYVRNNLAAPDASILDDAENWTVSIDGVREPRELTLRELRGLGLETLPMVLQCSGNGRGFFPNKPSGTPWQVGAAGCVIWAGVPLRRVVDLLGGAATGARYITGTGGETLPAGIDADSIRVERSVPIAALPDALLAWELNGAPIPLAHGGPLRLILPGYSGVNQIKYLRKLALTAEESRARIMSHGYRIAPPGSKADPSQPSVLQMNVKSWINSPSPAQAELRSGLTVIHGVAFGGTQAVRRVEVSIDGGERWQRARLVGPDLGRYAWRQFALEIDLPPGQHVLASRAIDARGNVQPRERMENVSGYNNNSWLDHAVRVEVRA